LKRFDFIKKKNPGDFKELGRWTHPDTGQLILYEVC